MHLRFLNVLLLCVLTIKLVYSENNVNVYRDASTGADGPDGDVTERNQYSMLCMDIRPQHSLDIDYIMGKWYGSEIIMHSHDMPGVFNYNSCVIIKVSDITEQMQAYRRRMYSAQQQQHQYQRPHRLNNEEDDSQTKYLRLVWEERDKGDLEYTFNYTEYNPGLWTNVGDQRGTLVATNTYTQFSGSVQVVKAVSDHLVLTFCGNGIRSSIYTIVLSRTDKGLSSDETLSIRKLLSRRGLASDSIRKVCKTSAALRQTPMSLGITLLGVVIILSNFTRVAI